MSARLVLVVHGNETQINSLAEFLHSYDVKWRSGTSLLEITCTSNYYILNQNPQKGNVFLTHCNTDPCSPATCLDFHLQTQEYIFNEIKLFLGIKTGELSEVIYHIKQELKN